MPPAPRLEAAPGAPQACGSPGDAYAAADGGDAARRAGAGSRWRGGLNRPFLGFADAPRNHFYTCNRKSK